MSRPRFALAGLTLAALACATAWEPPGLIRHQAALTRIPGQRLSDATPYLLPLAGERIAFFCRWPRERPLRVRLPADATPDEQRALEAALAAWQGVDLGLVFVRLAPDGAEPADVEIAFLAPERTIRAEGTGYTLADCRLRSLSAAASGAMRLEARLERARIRIVRRESEDWDAQDHAFFAGEVAGVALHELAHALGFQGHARFGGGILAPDTRESTRIGRALLRGAAFDEPTLRALYALPSGVVLERRAIPPQRTAPLDALRAAPPPGEGPFVRVGDRSGRIFWRRPDGREHGVTLTSVATALEHPERLVLLPDPAPNAGAPPQPFSSCFARSIRRSAGSVSPSLRSTTPRRKHSTGSSGFAFWALSRWSRARSGSDGECL